MQEFEELCAAKEFVSEKLGSSGGCHDMDHTMRVLANAENLLKELPDADGFCVRMAVWLHDICRPEEDESNGKVCHAVLGAECAEKYLRSRCYPEDLIRKITSAVRCHRYRGNNYPQTLEEQIVFDADKLDSIGAVGVGRAFLFAGKCGARLHNSSSEALSNPPYSLEDTAYREYLVKLRKLPDVIITHPARRIAEKRLKVMQAFFDELCGETGVK